MKKLNLLYFCFSRNKNVKQTKKSPIKYTGNMENENGMLNCHREE